MPNEQVLEVCELFYSIQGESSRAGFPCVFIRLAGCNLRCAYCDSMYAVEETGFSRTVTELLTYAGQYPGALVEITGGEPLLQENVYPLMQALLAAGRIVLLETNGSLGLDRVPAGVIKVMDMKCPDSGMNNEMDLHNLQLLGPNDEIKFVLSSRRDYDWAVRIVKTHGLDRAVGTAVNSAGKGGPDVVFSPVAALLPAAQLAAWLLEDRLMVRMRVQLHRIVWPGRERGV